MAATMTLQQSARILDFRKTCAGVSQTDRKNRLPALTSADIEGFFDHARLTVEHSNQAA